MWKTRYKHQYKTTDPNLIITAVCSFPNMIDTLEKAIVDYKVKELQKDSTYLQIESDYWFHHGRNFLPLYFEDDVPKLAKLQKVNPLGKGYFWCIGYRNPNFTEIHYSGSGRFNPPPFQQYEEWLRYWLKTYYAGKHDGIAKHLFEQCVRRFVFSKSKDLPERLQSRTFDLVSNKNLVFDYPEDPNDYLKFLDEMYVMNWYEFVFKSFK